MAQADFFQAENGTGEAVLAAFNQLTAAGITNNSGSTPPPAPQAGMPWHFWRDPEWGVAQRSRDNTAWLYIETYGLIEPPGVVRDEAAGYPIGAKASTQDGKVYFHTGSGVWQLLGTGGVGSSGGAGVFFGMTRYARSDDQVLLNMDYSGQTRFKR